MAMERWVRKASFSGLALAAIAIAGPAFAQSLNYNGGTNSPIDYATQAVLSDSTVLTAATVSLTSISLPATSASSTVTFTLPSGFTFASQPVVSCTLSVPADGTCTLGTVPAATGSTSLTVPFVYTITGGTPTISVQLAAGWTFNNAVVLATPPSTPLKISTTSNDANFGSGIPVTAQFAESQSALTFTAHSPSLGGITIDVNTSGLGEKFLQNGVDTLTADDGILQIQNNASVVDATNSTFTFPDGATVTVSGRFGGIASAFLTQPGVASCTGSPYLPGTVTGASITFPGVGIGIGKGAQEFCLVASGNHVIQSNNLASPTAVATIPATSTTAATTQTASSGSLNGYTYNGMVQQLLFSGDLGTTAYDYVVRVVNNTSSAVPLIAVVQPDSGPAGTALLSPIPGGTNRTIQAAGIVKAAGVGVGEVSIIMLAPGAACVNNRNGSNGGPTCPVTISGLLTNPNGTVVQIGSGATP